MAVKKKEYKETDIVGIVNLMPWDIYFNVTSTTNQNVKTDYMVPGYVTAEKLRDKTFKKCTFAQIQELINNNANAICGTDGYGSHAAIMIVDPDAYHQLFNTDDEIPVQLTDENTKKVLEAQSMSELVQLLEEYAPTSHEKRKLMFEIGKIQEKENNLMNFIVEGVKEAYMIQQFGKEYYNYVRH